MFLNVGLVQDEALLQRGDDLCTFAFKGGQTFNSFDCQMEAVELVLRQGPGRLVEDHEAGPGGLVAQRPRDPDRDSL